MSGGAHGSDDRPDAPADEVRDERSTPSSASLSVTGLFADARRRLAANPRAVVALVLAGIVVAGADWAHLQLPLPSDGYRGVRQGRFAVAFGLVVGVQSRATLVLSTLPALESGWLLVAVGLELARVAAVTLAATYALGELLDVEPSTPALVRYGLVLLALRYPLQANFTDGALLIGLPLVVAVLYLMVRLLPLPGRLVLGERFRTALGRSWAATSGHASSLAGVVLLVGLANHLAASVPVVGPVGSGGVAAFQAGVVAAVVERTGAE